MKNASPVRTFLQHLKVRLGVFCLGITAAGLAQVQQTEAGRVLEKVTCLKNPNQSYALYLPSYYSPDRKWPILYAFDAGARGALPVARFKTAAEKYGYIIAGSNNSRNGPIKIAEEALTALIADTKSRFVLNDQRVYVAGFSGGARIAIAAGLSTKIRVSGVIACGAGFPESFPPTAPRTFTLFGAVGFEDFNFLELRSLDDTLEKMGLTHRLEAFNGGHEWPPESTCMHAIEWLEIQAVKSGSALRNTNRIDEIYAKLVTEAQQSESRKDLYEAYQLNTVLAKDFAGLKDIGVFETKVRGLKQSREVRDAINREKTVSERQTRIQGQLGRLLNSAVEGASGALEAQELIQNFAGLRLQADQTKNEVERLVARRILNLFWVRLNQEASLDFENKDFSHAALRLELTTEIRPESPGAFYNLACAYARTADRKKALKALNDAVARGFSDPTELQKDADFDSIRGDPGFQTILDALKKKQP